MQAVVDGTLLLLDCEFALSVTASASDLVRCLEILSPVVERMPCRVARIGDGIRRAQVELDVGLGAHGFVGGRFGDRPDGLPYIDHPVDESGHLGGFG